MPDAAPLPPLLPAHAARGRFWVAAAAVLWSSSGLFAKADLFADWPCETRGLVLAFWRAVFAAAVLLPFVRRPRWRADLVPLGLAFAAMNGSYLSAMVLTTAANAIWLQNLCPWWVFLFGVLVFREPVVRRDLVPLVFAMLGVGAILYFEIGRQVAPWGVSLGVASGVFFALVLIFMSRLRAENPAWLIAFCLGVTALFLLPLVWHAGIRPSMKQFAVLAAFGALQMALPYLCLLRGLQSVRSQEAVVIALLEPTLLPVWVYLAWGERPAWWTIAGAGLILVGLLWRYGRADRFSRAPPLPTGRAAD